MSPTLIIFIKNPELGKAKTRLAQDVGPEKALQIYQTLLAHTRKVTQAVPAQRLLFYSSFVDAADAWSADDFDKHLQASGGLGHRMEEAFTLAFGQNNGPVLIIGSDCAQLNASIVQQGIDALQENDFVIGPAEDGGYYLLGMQAFHPEVFRDIEWSTSAVFPQTRAIIEAHNWSLSLLPILSDIDYLEDWEKHGWEIP
ncbi:MAG: TIGR04282 family arsenosugar biosynthesis glycosyltransferase [Bacteroidota bacterium]